MGYRREKQESWWSRWIRESNTGGVNSFRQDRRDRRCVPWLQGLPGAAPLDVFPDAVCRLPIRSEARGASHEPSDSRDSFGDPDRHSRTCGRLLQFSRRVEPNGARPEPACAVRSFQRSTWPNCHNASAHAPMRHSTASRARSRSCGPRFRARRLPPQSQKCRRVRMPSFIQ